MGLVVVAAAPWCSKGSGRVDTGSQCSCTRWRWRQMSHPLGQHAVSGSGVGLHAAMRGARLEAGFTESSRPDFPGDRGLMQFPATGMSLLTMTRLFKLLASPRSPVSPELLTLWSSLVLGLPMCPQ